jgi:hypothetical protein
MGRPANPIPGVDQKGAGLLVGKNTEETVDAAAQSMRKDKAAILGEVLPGASRVARGFTDENAQETMRKAVAPRVKDLDKQAISAVDEALGTTGKEFTRKGVERANEPTQRQIQRNINRFGDDDSIVVRGTDLYRDTNNGPSGKLWKAINEAPLAKSDRRAMEDALSVLKDNQSNVEFTALHRKLTDMLGADGTPAAQKDLISKQLLPMLDTKLTKYNKGYMEALESNRLNAKGPAAREEFTGQGANLQAAERVMGTPSPSREIERRGAALGLRSKYGEKSGTAPQIAADEDIIATLARSKGSAAKFKEDLGNITQRQTQIKEMAPSAVAKGDPDVKAAGPGATVAPSRTMVDYARQAVRSITGNRAGRREEAMAEVLSSTDPKVLEGVKQQIQNMKIRDPAVKTGILLGASMGRAGEQSQNALADYLRSLEKKK